MDNIQVNQFSYNFDNGQIASAQVGLYSNNAANAEYINASIKVKPDDLPEGKGFMQLAMNDLITIAKNKLAADTAVKTESTEPINQ